MSFKDHQHSAETKAKMSAARRGKPHPRRPHPHTEESRAKLAVWNHGRQPTEATRAKQSASHLGHRHSEETKAKMSTTRRGRPSPMKGHHHRAESRAKTSATLRAKPSKGMTGRRHSQQTRAKMSTAHRSQIDADPALREQLQAGAKQMVKTRHGIASKRYGVRWRKTVVGPKVAAKLRGRSATPTQRRALAAGRLGPGSKDLMALLRLEKQLRALPKLALLVVDDLVVDARAKQNVSRVMGHVRGPLLGYILEDARKAVDDARKVGPDAEAVARALGIKPRQARKVLAMVRLADDARRSRRSISDVIAGLSITAK